MSEIRDTNNEYQLTIEKNDINTQTNGDDIRIQTNEEKFKAIFMGTLFTTILLIISLSYGLTWAILFLIYTKKDDYDEKCETLIKWDKALYIVLFITSFLHLISSVIQLISSAYEKDSNISQYITFCRSCINYIAGMVILIGINVAYYELEDPEICNSLSTLNLAFIITEWSIIGFLLCFIFVVCVLSLILKKKKNAFS